MQIHSTAGGLSSAAHTAVGAIRAVETRVANVAHNVAANVVREPEEPVAEMFSEIAKLPGLRMQAAANVRVINTVDDLFDELGSLLVGPRR